MSQAAISQATDAAWQDASIAAKYARGEVATRPFADILVRKSGLVEAEGDIYVLDIASGTGAVEAAIYEAYPKEKWAEVKILATDVSDSMLQWVKARGEREGWANVETQIVDGRDINLPPNTYSHVFINFGIFMLPSTALAQCYSVLRSQGAIGISSWFSLAWIAILQRAVARLPSPRPYCPTYSEIEEAIYKNRPWNLPSYVTEQLQDAGFKDLQVFEEEREMAVGTPEQTMEPMLMPLKMVSTWWEESDRERLVGEVSKEMINVFAEDAQDGIVRMKFHAILGVGRKGA